MPDWYLRFILLLFLFGAQRVAPSTLSTVVSTDMIRVGDVATRARRSITVRILQLVVLRVVKSPTRAREVCA